MMCATDTMSLTCSVILEEGFDVDALQRIQQSMFETCRIACAPVVTGDTKVMGRGEIDGVVINTTGIGLTKHLVRDNGLRVGDKIVRMPATHLLADHGPVRAVVER